MRESTDNISERRAKVPERYTYYDFGTTQTRWTEGRFIGWSKDTGPAQVPYAGFKRRVTTLWIPKYLLTKETKQKLVELEERQE